MKKLNTYILTLLLCLPNAIQSTIIDTYIEPAIAAITNTIIFSTYAAYQKLKLHNKIKNVIASLQKNNQTYAQHCQKKLIDKWYQAMIELCFDLKLDPISIIQKFETRFENDLSELRRPLSESRKPIVHSENIPNPILELIIKLFYMCKLSPYQIQITTTKESNSISVHIEQSEFEVIGRWYQMEIPEYYFKLSLTELEVIITHEITHILAGHLILDEILCENTQKTKTELLENYPNYIKLVHLQEYIADLCVCINSPMYIHALKNYFKSECWYQLEEIFQSYWTHPSMFSRIKKLQKTALYLDYEHQSKTQTKIKNLIAQ